MNRRLSRSPFRTCPQFLNPLVQCRHFLTSFYNYIAYSVEFHKESHYCGSEWLRKGFIFMRFCVNTRHEAKRWPKRSNHIILLRFTNG
jgi:hypothetical protein